MDYWRTDYDWRCFERHLDRLGQFRTVIDGVGIHFLHRRSTRPDAVPLLATHGWPGSIVEFIDVVGELADPKDPDAPAFHVVVPSLPGYGYSDKPAVAGWGIEKIAAAWVELMRRLGYREFTAHGGDWGGSVTTVLAGRFPAHVLGIHTTFAQAPPGVTTDGLTAVERDWAERTRDFWHRRAAYAKQQATGPQTIGYSLVDSPVGLLAWLLDKFAEWSDTEDSPVRDDLRRPNPRRRHPVLADPHRRLGRPPLPREPRRPRPRTPRRRPLRDHHVSSRHREVPTPVGRTALPPPRPLERARTRRTFPIPGSPRLFRPRPTSGLVRGTGRRPVSMGLGRARWWARRSVGVPTTYMRR